MPKGSMLVVVAFMLDMAQGLIMLSFTGVTTVLTSFLNLIPVVGTLASGAASVAGMVVGDAIDVALSFGFGAFLVMWLVLDDSFYLSAFMGASFFEVIFPFLPGWTVLALRSAYNKYQEDKLLEQNG